MSDLTADERPLHRSPRIMLAFALLLPVVLFLSVPDTVIFGNLENLGYSERMSAIRLAMLVASALGIFLLFLLAVRCGRGATTVRIIGFLALLFLANNVLASVLTSSNRLGLVVLVDMLVVALCAFAAFLLPLRLVLGAGSAIGGLLLTLGLAGHVWEVRHMSAADRRDKLWEDVEEQDRSTASAEPRAPGNVYHLVPDGFHGLSFEPLLEMSGRAETFADWHHYRNYTSPTSLTFSSVSASLRGRAYESGEDFTAYWEGAYEEGLWGALADQGVGVSAYSFRPYYCAPTVSHCVTPKQMEGAVLDRATIDLSFLRLAPATVQRLLDRVNATVGTEDVTDFGFSITSWLTGASDAVFQARGGLAETRFSLEAFDRMIAEEAKRPATGQYVFWHGLMPHDPYLYGPTCEFERDTKGSDEIGYQNQALCALHMVERLEDRLRELGRLDDSMIIVHSDHGHMFSAQALQKEYRRIVDGRPSEHLIGPLFPGHRPGDELPDTTQDELYSRDTATWYSEDVATRSNALLAVRFPRGVEPNSTDKPILGIDIGPTIAEHFGAELGESRGLPLWEIDSRAPRTPSFLIHNHVPTYYRPAKISRYLYRNGTWVFAEDLPGAG